MKMFFPVAALLVCPSVQADEVCTLYRYSCVPELDYVEVETMTEDNQGMCAKLLTTPTMRKALAKNHRLHIAEYGVEEFKEPICNLSKGAVKLNISTIAPPPHGNGSCGAAPGTVEVNVQGNGKRLTAPIRFVEDCLSSQRISRLRYEVAVLDKANVQGEFLPQKVPSVVVDGQTGDKTFRKTFFVGENGKIDGLTRENIFKDQ